MYCRIYKKVTFAHRRAGRTPIYTPLPPCGAAKSVSGRNRLAPKPGSGLGYPLAKQGLARMTIVSTSWGVLVAHHMRYRKVDEILTERGVDHFIPLIETLMISHGRHVRQMRPLLGDYILIAVCSAWKSLLRIREVRGIMLNELGYPAQVLPFEMDRMRLMCEGDVCRSSVVEDGGFEYGQRVSPKAGPLGGRVGRYDKKTKRGDSALFVLFGQEQRVIFKQGELVSAGGDGSITRKASNSGRWKKLVNAV